MRLFIVFSVLLLLVAFGAYKVAEADGLLDPVKKSELPKASEKKSLWLDSLDGLNRNKGLVNEDTTYYGSPVSDEYVPRARPDARNVRPNSSPRTAATPRHRAAQNRSNNVIMNRLLTDLDNIKKKIRAANRAHSQNMERINNRFKQQINSARSDGTNTNSTKKFLRSKATVARDGSILGAKQRHKKNLASLRARSRAIQKQIDELKRQQKRNNR